MASWREIICSNFRSQHSRARCTDDDIARPYSLFEIRSTLRNVEPTDCTTILVDRRFEIPYLGIELKIHASTPEKEIYRKVSRLVLVIAYEIQATQNI